MKKRLIIGLSVLAVLVMVAVVALTVGLPVIGGSPRGEGVTAAKAIYSDTSAPLREMAEKVEPDTTVPDVMTKARRLPDGTTEIIQSGEEIKKEIPDALAGPPAAPQVNIQSSTSPGSPDASFEGVNADTMSEAAFENLLVVAPPDPTGEAGLTQYFQWVNVAFQVFDKATGASILGPVAGNALWLGMAGTPPSPGAPTPVCATENHGDPIVTWDQLANRWVISQFAFVGAAGIVPYYQCIAVSATSDATGAWHRYVFPVHTTYFHDYPKVSVWPDAYFMSANQFVATPAGVGLLRGAGAWAFDRAKMLTGDPSATYQYFDLETQPGVSSILPADIEGTKKLSGRPNYFLMADDGANTLRLWEFKVNWANPTMSTFGVGSTPGPLGIAGTPNQIMSVTPFATQCGNTRNCVPQLQSPDGLDALGPRLMWRLVYRIVGSFEYMAVNHTVSVDNPNAAPNENGIRWYILRRRLATTRLPGETTWSVWQQGDYGGDGVHRFMGSVAMDKFGNLAVGYSASNASIHPDIRYNGRLFGDTLNTFGLGEQTVWAGLGSQLGTQNRWGDYTHLSIDPVDDCTFWYTNQYYGSPLDTTVALNTTPPFVPPIIIVPDTDANDSFDWRTRIGSFRFPNCPAPVT